MAGLGNDSFGGAVALTSTLYGGQGNDTLSLTTGSTGSRIYLDNGDDLFSGGGAYSANTISGGSGNDTIVVNAVGAGVASGTGLSASIVGGSGNDVITFSGVSSGAALGAIDSAYASTGVFTITGAAGSAGTLTLGTQTISFVGASSSSSFSSTGTVLTFVTVSSSTITSLG